MTFVRDPAFEIFVDSMYAYPKEEVQGVAMFRVGKCWWNTPFYEYGLDESEVTAELLDALPQPFQVKVVGPSESREAGRFPTATFAKIASLDLRPDIDDEAFLASLRKRTRQAVGRAVRRGYEARVAPLDAEGLGPFYDRYVRYIQSRHGSPCVAKAHFERLAEAYGEKLLLSVVRGPEGERAAWLLGFVHEPTKSCQVTDIVCDPARMVDNVNDLVYWGLMRHLRARGIERFDFGIARYEGQTFYKKKWGCEFRNLHVVMSRPGLEPKDPDQGIYPFVREAWKRLPFPIHAWLGPKLRARLGQ